MRFFTLRVASNKEDRVREALIRKVKIEGVENVVGRILVPTERVRSMKGGVRKESDRKLYPGYVFIELDLDKNGMIPEKVWFMLRCRSRLDRITFWNSSASAGWAKSTRPSADIPSARRLR